METDSIARQYAVLREQFEAAQEAERRRVSLDPVFTGLVGNTIELVKAVAVANGALKAINPDVPGCREVQQIRCFREPLEEIMAPVAQFSWRITFYAPVTMMLDPWNVAIPAATGGDLPDIASIEMAVAEALRHLSGRSYNGYGRLD